MVFKTKQLLAFALSLSISIPLLTWAQVPPAQEDDADRPPTPQEQQAYQVRQAAAYYMQQALELYHKNQITQAIEFLQKAYLLNPSETSILNNLSACYVQQGVYFYNTKKDYSATLGAYRKARYYLVLVWPDGVTRSQEQQTNVGLIDGNISAVLQSQNVKVSDWQWHLKTAQTLREKGQLIEALVEYAWVTQYNPKSAEAWEAQGDIWRVQQHPEKALPVYQKAVAVKPSDSVFLKLGTTYTKLNQPDKAADAFNQALSLNTNQRDALLGLEVLWRNELQNNPRNLSATVNLGAVLQQLGRYDEAAAQYQVADRLAPNNPLVKANMASLLQAKGDWQQALAAYDAMLKQNPNDITILTQKYTLLTEQNQTQAAEAVMQQLIAISPDKKGLLKQQITLYQSKNQPEKVVQAYQQYLQRFPSDTEILYEAGLYFHGLKQFEPAIAYYQRAVALDPQNAELLGNLGRALHAVGKEDQALEALKQAIAIDPGVDNVKPVIAEIENQGISQTVSQADDLYQKQQFEQALSLYEQLLPKANRFPDVYTRYGLTLQALTRNSEAIQAYNKAIKANPKNAIVYYYRGTAQETLNQLPAAQQSYQQALQLDASLTDAKDSLNRVKAASLDTVLQDALTAYNTQNYPKALILVDQALQKDARNAMALYYKGLVYDAQKKPALAQAAYEQAIKANPDFSDPVYALAVVYDSQGQKAKAKQTYLQFLQLTQSQPEDDFIRYAKERINSL